MVKRFVSSLAVSVGFHGSRSTQSTTFVGSLFHWAIELTNIIHCALDAGVMAHGVGLLFSTYAISTG